jgi:hypothetical protein
LTPGERRINTYRFPDGAIHSLRKLWKVRPTDLHSRWHTTPQIGCEFCFPPPEPEPQPEPAVEEVELPKPQPEIKSETEVVEVEEPTTAMSAAFAAFNRLFKS